MSEWRNKSHAVRFLIAGGITVLLAIATLLWMGMSVLYLTAHLLIFCVVTALLWHPTAGRRFWAAILMPVTVLLLIMPRGIREAMAELRKRENWPPEL